MKAFYAGSFDPFTTGHLYVAHRALECCGELVIGIGLNESKKNEYSIDERILNIQKIFAGNPSVTIFAYDGLTALAAKEKGALMLVRGVRNTIDFEKEKELADINLKIFGIPTIMIPAPSSLSFISSSMVRELSHFGYDVSEFLPSTDI